MHPTKFRHNRATELVYSTHAIECTQPNNAVGEEKIAFYHEILFCLRYYTNARNFVLVYIRKSVSRKWFVYCTRHRGSSST